MFKHILLPTDGSELSNAAILEGVRFAKGLGARVTGLCVMPQQHPFFYETEIPVSALQEAAKRYRELADGYLAVISKAAKEGGVACEVVNKVVEGRPHIVDLIKNDEIVYIVNTTEGRQAIADSFSIRREALQHRITYSTTIAGARALLQSLEYRGTGPVWSLQELHAEIDAA